MRAKTLMIQGSASSVGKSTLVTALYRIFKQDGWNVAPFKAQNMSLNSYVTGDSAEMGRAQVVQAAAACVEPMVEMNPVLLKPEADNRSQVVFLGLPLASLAAKDYYALRTKLWKGISESLDSLMDRYELVIMEGAGSPAKINLKKHAMVNMRVALHCRAPVVLVADIDRGGVFASLVGTLELLDPPERALIKTIVINKFRGDLSLLPPGLDWLENRTGVPVAGVIPYYHDISIAEENSVSLEQRRAMKAKDKFLLDIAVIGLGHISNFDDFDPLEQETQVRVRYVQANDDLGAPDLIIGPGTKNTMTDLAELRSRGLDQTVVDRSRNGIPVIGICGGYQMLGQRIHDPEQVESPTLQAPGLGLLPVSTTFLLTKMTRQVCGRVAADKGLLSGALDLPIRGYGIHMGETDGVTILAFTIEERSRKPGRESDG